MKSNAASANDSFSAAPRAALHLLPGYESRLRLGSRPPTRATASDKQRARILAATAELLAECSYGGLAVVPIVKRARVSFKTFYKHFSGKEAACLALFDATTQRAMQGVAEVLAAQDGPWPDRLGAALGAVIDTAAADPFAARACLAEALSVGPAGAERQERALQAIARFLREGRDLSPYGTELPESLEIALASGFAWTLQQRLLAGPAARLGDFFPEALRFLLAPYLGEAEAERLAARTLPEPLAASREAGG